MKRLFYVIIALILLTGSVSISEEISPYSDDKFEEARALASFMEDHYDVTILIGSECSAIDTLGFKLVDKRTGRTPLLNMLGYVDCEDDVKRLDDCFSFYPSGFFSKFRSHEAEKGLRILLPNRIVADNVTMAGVTTKQDGYYNVFLGLAAFIDPNVHHEIWHAMELRITADYPEIFNDWDTLNPKGFVYCDNSHKTDLWNFDRALGKYFVCEYSVSSEMEDRATVIEAFFTKNKKWWRNHPLIQKKMDKMIAASDLIFGNVYNDE